jgi:hypothetical protein
MRHNRRHPAYAFQHGDLPSRWMWRIVISLSLIGWAAVIGWLLP